MHKQINIFLSGLLFAVTVTLPSKCISWCRLVSYQRNSLEKGIFLNYYLWIWWSATPAAFMAKSLGSDGKRSKQNLQSVSVVSVGLKLNYIYTIYIWERKRYSEIQSLPCIRSQDFSRYAPVKPEWAFVVRAPPHRNAGSCWNWTEFGTMHHNGGWSNTYFWHKQ